MTCLDSPVDVGGVRVGFIPVFNKKLTRRIENTAHCFSYRDVAHGFLRVVET